MVGYGIQGSMAFGSNELFKELITYLDAQSEENRPSIMPMSHILLSGVLTGMVSTLAIVINKRYRLQQTIHGSFFKKNVAGIANIEAQLMLGVIYIEDSV